MNHQRGHILYTVQIEDFAVYNKAISRDSESVQYTVLYESIILALDAMRDLHNLFLNVSKSHRSRLRDRHSL